MNAGGKLGTALGLLARGEWGVFRRQLHRYQRGRRLARAGGSPFVHRTAGFPLVCFPDMADSVYQYHTGGDDHWERSLVQAWLEPGDAFVDAGANMGLYSHAVAGHFAGAVQVLALEASPHLAQRINEGAALLGERNLRAVSVAVGQDPGEVTFHLARPGATTTSQSMMVSRDEAADYEPHMLPMRPLRDLAGEYLPGKRVAAVKIDVEGAEPLAIRGAPAAWLTGTGPLWLIELNPDTLARLGFSADDVLASLREEEFERWVLPKFPTTPGPVRPRRLAAGEKFADAPFHNLVALPRAPAAASRRQRVAGFLQ